MKYLLDEDLNPLTAEIACGLGLDVVSVHDVGRRGLSDVDQLEYAAGERRVLVTRNRDDFIELTLAFFRTRQPHAGILIVPHSLPNRDAKKMAHALAGWHAARMERGGLYPYTIDFL